ncbi:hypothetical protein LCGC14_2621410 [marine sediment metagenome]|uniref:Uncharacterized protein n=1 Tax=marine sediment metagenome TaxID=412755 RepID=A0A0F9A2W9_9ZZZZ
MANAKISALPAVTTPASTDEIAVNQGGTTKKETRAQLHTLESGETIDSVSGVDLVLERAGAGDITIGANIVTIKTTLAVSVSGPHAIGGSANTRFGLDVAGSFTGSGTANNAMQRFAGALTGLSGSTSFLHGMIIGNTIVTQTASENIAIISQVSVEEPSITDNLTGDITVATAVDVVAAPTEGEVNSAVRIRAGSIVCQAAALATNATTGFLYIPTSAGAPSGTPEAHVGVVAMQFDTTNDNLYVYDGAWIKVAMAA